MIQIQQRDSFILDDLPKDVIADDSHLQLSRQFRKSYIPQKGITIFNLVKNLFQYTTKDSLHVLNVRKQLNNTVSTIFCSLHLDSSSRQSRFIEDL